MSKTSQITDIIPWPKFETEFKKYYSEEAFYLYMKVLLQEKNTPNKIYSLHEIDAYAITKAKTIKAMSLELEHRKKLSKRLSWR